MLPRNAKSSASFFSYKILEKEFIFSRAVGAEHFIYLFFIYLGCKHKIYKYLHEELKG